MKKVTMKVSSREKLSRISPFIFGNFVEDMKDHMPGMLKGELHSEDFEREDTQYKGVSFPWFPLNNDESVEYSLESAAPKHSGHCQCIKINPEAKRIDGIGQYVTLEASKKYKVNIVCRTSVEIEHIYVDVFNCSAKVVTSANCIVYTSHDWKQCEFILENGVESSLQCLRVYVDTEKQSWKGCHSNGFIWIDHISLSELGDNDCGIRAPVLDLIRQLNCGLLRWGGNQMSAYHWKHYIAPLMERPCLRSEAWGHWTAKKFGTDEYIALCRAIGAEPLICVNAGSGCAEEAADWVEYCNGSSDSFYGAIRAANGFPEPYGVKFWEIGNEIWGERQVGHCSVQEYSERLIEFSRRMREKDSSIRIIACGHTDPSWNEYLLNKAASCFDYLSIHYYHGLDIPISWIKPNSETEYRYFVSMAESVNEILERAKKLLAARKEYSHIRIAFTEYNTAYAKTNDYRRKPDQHTLETALSIAGALNSFIRNSDLVEIANFSDLVNGWPGGCIRVTACEPIDSPHDSICKRVIYKTPAYHVLSAYSQMKPRYLLRSTLSGDVYSFSQCPDRYLYNNFLTQTQELTAVHAVACMDEQENTIIFACNRLLEEVDLVIELDISIKSCEAIFIGGDDNKEYNCEKDPDRLNFKDIEIMIDRNSVKFIMCRSSVYIVKLCN